MRANPRATTIREAIDLMTLTGRRPVGRQAEAIRRAYKRGTLDQATLTALAKHGADKEWFAPQRSVFERNVLAVVEQFLATGQLPDLGERLQVAPGSDKPRRWLRELRAAAVANGTESPDARLLTALEALASAATDYRANR
jgi:hypothetical protein